MIVLGISSCSSSEAKSKFFRELRDRITNKIIKVKLKAPQYQSWQKCTARDVRLHGKSFAYKENFCYRWCSKIKRTKPYTCRVWQVKPYHMVKDHDIMVQRGIWHAGDTL